MQDQQNSRRLSLGFIAGVSVAILAVGGGTAWWAINSLTSSKTPSEPTTSQPQKPLTEQPSVYWLNPTGDKIELAPSAVTTKKTAQPREVLESAFKLLLAGPRDQTYTTTIPKETKLLGITMENNGIHVNLSQEFIAGGGSASMTGRLAQVLYTATSLDPQSKVWIDVEGEPLQVLGGEGITINQPMTRKDFEANFAL